MGKVDSEHCAEKNSRPIGLYDAHDGFTIANIQKTLCLYNATRGRKHKKRRTASHNFQNYEMPKQKSQHISSHGQRI